MELLYKLLGVSTAIAEEAAAATEMTGAQMVISTVLSMSPILIMVLLMYFLMIRPEKKRKKKEKAMLDALKRGDRICTIGGIYGTIAEIKEDTITIAVGAQKTQMVIARWAIRSVEDAPLENDTELTA